MSDAALAPPHVFPPAPPRLAADPVVARVKAALAAHYGDRLKGLVVYGSRARGEATAESDWDFLALVDGVEAEWAERLELGRRVIWPLEVDLAVALSVHPVAPEAPRRRTGYFHNLRAGGLAV